MKLHILVCLFLLLPFVSAENITKAALLEAGKPFELEGHTVVLHSIGTIGSLRLSIDSQEFIINDYGEKRTFNGVEVRVISIVREPTSGGIAKVELTTEKKAECVTNENCEAKAQVCSTASCQNNKCVFIQNGCLLDTECYPIGSKESGGYCSGLEWVREKTVYDACTENYECASNVCLNNKCSPVLVGEEITGSAIKGQKSSGAFAAVLLILILLFVVLTFFKRARKKEEQHL